MSLLWCIDFFSSVTTIILLFSLESAVSEYYEISQKDGRSIRCPVPGLRFPLSVYFKDRSSTTFAEILRVEDGDKRRTLRKHKITFDDHQAIYINNLSLGDEGEYKIITGSPEEILLYMKVTILPSFRVIGPSAPVVAVVGQDVLLSCHLSPPISAENMQIRWFRKNFESLVHLFENGMDQNKQQLPEYQNRTKLFRDRISSGNMSLRIRNVRPTDEGRYTCYVESDIYEEATMELKIGSTEVSGRHHYKLITAALLLLLLLHSVLLLQLYCFRWKSQSEGTPEPQLQNKPGSREFPLLESQAGGKERSLVTAAAALESNGTYAQEAKCEVITFR